MSKIIKTFFSEYQAVNLVSKKEFILFRLSWKERHDAGTLAYALREIQGFFSSENSDENAKYLACSQCVACIRFVCHRCCTNKVQLGAAATKFPVCDGCYNYITHKCSDNQLLPNNNNTRQSSTNRYYNHPNMMRQFYTYLQGSFQGSFQKGSFPLCVYESLDDELQVVSLSNYVYPVKISWSDRISILRDVVRGLDYLIRKDKNYPPSFQSLFVFKTRVHSLSLWMYHHREFR